MPHSKNSLLRYKTIDSCLCNRKRKWTLQDLIKACEQALHDSGKSNIAMVSLKTIKTDLHYMRSEAGFSAPIVVVDHKYYTYADPDFSITKVPLTPDTVTKLSEAVSLLKQLTGFTDMAGTEDIISRLDDRLESLKTQQKPVLYPEQDNLPNGRQYIPIIHQAIVEKSVLAIRYKSSRAYEPRTYIISPYALREFRYRWFVFGQHSKSNTLVSFALDSILSIEVFNGATYHADPDFDPTSYFEDIVGVTRNNEPVQKVRFGASPETAPLIQSRPVHKSQQTIEQNEDGSATFEVRVIINNELIRELMSYGEGIIVHSPHSLVETMQKKYTLGLNRYTSPER